tara:strand:+ start:187 stop:303 length:117 start_codon:yes stop_codon:yes gene_type:complete
LPVVVVVVILVVLELVVELVLVALCTLRVRVYRRDNKP